MALGCIRAIIVHGWSLPRGWTDKTLLIRQFYRNGRESAAKISQREHASLAAVSINDVQCFP